MNNLEWLYSLEGEERKAWFDAEHVDARSKTQSKTEPKLSELFGILSDANDDLAPKSDVIADDVDANDGNVDSREKHESCRQDADQAEHANVDGGESYDSREKLESDACEFVGKAWVAGTNYEGNHHGDVGWRKDELFALLDRQAAITEREGREEWQKAASGEIFQAKQEADELRSERDEWQRTAEDYQGRKDELRAERDLWNKRYQQSHEHALELQAKIGELTAEIVQLESCEGCDVDAVIKANIRGYTKRNAELTAERDNLVADLADAMKRLKDAQGEIKTQRNNFDQVQGSRDYWREKLSILLARLRDMGCKTGSINDLPIEIELPDYGRDEGMA